MHVRSTSGHRQSSASFCRAHRSATPVRRVAVVATSDTIARHGGCAPVRARRRLVLGGLASWALLTAGTLVLLSALS